jgi:hypothetical protein
MDPQESIVPGKLWRTDTLVFAEIDHFSDVGCMSAKTGVSATIMDPQESIVPGKLWLTETSVFAEIGFSDFGFICIVLG